MPFDDGFVEVKECDIPCQDAWPMTKIRKTAMVAYRQLREAGDIRIRYPVLFYHDCVVFNYDAALPHEWIREALRAKEQDLIQEATAERDRLENRLIELEAVMNESLLPIFEQTAARHRQIQQILL